MAGYRVTDHRRQEWAEKFGLPEVSKELAAEAAETTTEAFLPAKAPKEDPNARVLVQPLDILRPQFGEFFVRHRQGAEVSGFMKAFKEMLPAFAKDATHLALGGEVIASYRHDGRLSVSELKKVRPDIIAKYTRIRSVEVFDEDAFRADDPATHEMFRGRSLRLLAPKPQILPGS